MSADSSFKMNGFINFPRQKLSTAKKTPDWYKKNIDFAENILTTDTDLRASFKNKKTNYNLRANIINVHDFARFINPDNLDLESLPASFQHIGIENNKINLLLGEYAKRRHDWKAYISANDQEGVSRKEDLLMNEMKQTLHQIITGNAQSEEEIQAQLEKFDKYLRYDFQDVAEITANKILKREVRQQNIDFKFLTTFEDLLTAGEQIMYCGVLGKEPVMRRVDTRNFFTLGGNTMNVGESDIQVEYGYLSVGQVVDDYWDELTEEDMEFLESGGMVSNSSRALGMNRDISVYDFFGHEAGDIEIFHPNELGARTFAGAFDTYGNVRVVKVVWRSRRKIGNRKYFDEDGEEQHDYVDEYYKPRKELGEEVKWEWVNEWLEGTKIADHIYVNMRPVPYAGKSLTNKSKGTSPYVGNVNSTNGYKVQSLMDIMKPLTYSYDIAYYKRELAISTYKGSFAALNASMVPSGWDPEKWMRYVTVNKYGWLDPTNEILKGPSQGKSAGAFNTLTAANVQIGDPNEIQMYTNLLLDIKNQLGEIAGITGAREGQIQNREAVGNVEREVTQTSHITEKWFAIDANFRKRVLEKFLECCKYAYKNYPQRAQYLMDDMGMVMIQHFDEFANSEMDIHISNSREDTMLYNELKQLSHAAIQNGQAKIGDLISIVQSESVQEIGRKLSESSEKIAQEQTEREQAARQSQEKMNQEKIASEQNKLDREDYHKNEDRKIEWAKLEQDGLKHAVDTSLKNGEAIRRDSDKNGIDDELDIRRTNIDEVHKTETRQLQRDELEEKKRANMAKEEIQRKAANKKPAVSK